MSAQVFMSGQRRYWGEKTNNYTSSVIAVSIAVASKAKNSHCGVFCLKSHSQRARQRRIPQGARVTCLTFVILTLQR